MVETGTDLELDLAFCRRWMLELAASVESSCDHLTELDSAIGDADHGINLRRGLRSVAVWLDSPGVPSDPAMTLEVVGGRFISEVGGASGPLYGMAFRTMGELMEGVPLDLTVLTQAISAGLVSIQRLGAAEIGDKTIVDAWAPAVAALHSSVDARSSVIEALGLAERAAAEGRDATVPLRARKGRASYLGWRSEGHQDPGATSTHLIFQSLLEAAS